MRISNKAYILNWQCLAFSIQVRLYLMMLCGLEKSAGHATLDIVTNLNVMINNIFYWGFCS